MATRGPGTFGADQLPADALAHELSLVASPPRTLRREWYDTFDWRLWDAGLVLEVDRAGGRGGNAEAALRGRADNGARWTTTATSVPRTSADLPSGPWHRSLEPLLGPRALMPVGRAAVEQVTMPVRDRHGKIRVEARWERLAPDGPADDGASPPARTVVRVMPVRGYGADAEALIARLRHLGLEPLGHPLELANLGTEPGVDVTSSAVDLAPGLPAAEAFRAVLTRLAAVMAAVEPWLDDPPDIEFLHDHRVALRRSRSVLRQARGVLAPEARDEWRSALRDLQQRTNLARDLDVFMEELPTYGAAVPPAFAADLAPLGELLRSRRADEHTRLAAHLRSDEHRALLASYGELLRAPLPTEGAPDADRPIAEVAAARIKRAHKLVVRLGRAVTDASPPEAIHEVRIAAKELRYLLEVFESLLPTGRRRSLVRDLKRFQDNLGAFQDAEVHALAILGFAEDLKRRKDVPARTLMAIGLLADGFTRRQAVARDRFAESFAEFGDQKTSRRVTRLVAAARDRAR